MAHFASIDSNWVVLDVVVVNNDDIGNLSFPESEPAGKAFLANILPGQNFVQTSYNNNFRVRYAIVGGTYSPQYDAFIAPQPYPSWSLNPETTMWAPPVPYPSDGRAYHWDEATKSWVLDGIPFAVIG